MRRAVLLLAAVLAGCAAGPDFKHPELPAGADYADAALPRGEPALAEWWTQFQSPDIDALVREALASSPNVAAAGAALRASEASLRSGSGVFWPRLDLAASATRNRISPFRLGAAGSAVMFNLVTLEAAVSYTIDVFGGNRRAVEKLSAGVDYERALEQATLLTLTGNVVNAAIASGAYRAEIESLERLLALQQREAALVEVQWNAGTAPYSAVVSAREQVAATQAALPALRQRLAAANDLLATLSGSTPAQWKAVPPDFERIALPAPIPLSLPSDLARQRPDIVAAEANLHAASAQVGIATAALFPTITLSANGGGMAPDLSSAGENSARFGSAGGTIDIPVFSGFSGIEEREAARELYEQAYAQYRQTVVNAFGQVADALHAIDNDAQLERAQREAHELAVRQHELAQANGAAGLASEQQVNLVAQAVEASRLNLIQARAQHLQDSAALYLALGRPWNAYAQAASR